VLGGVLSPKPQPQDRRTSMSACSPTLGRPDAGLPAHRVVHRLLRPEAARRRHDAPQRHCLCRQKSPRQRGIQGGEDGIDLQRGGNVRRHVVHLHRGAVPDRIRRQC
jgi:hypothetical protein